MLQCIPSSVLQLEVSQTMQASDLHTFLLLTQSNITKQTQVTDQIISNSTNIIFGMFHRIGCFRKYNYFRAMEKI